MDHANSPAAAAQTPTFADFVDVSRQHAALSLAQSYRRLAEQPAFVLESAGLVIAAQMAEAFADGLAPVPAPGQHGYRIPPAPAQADASFTDHLSGGAA